MPVPKIPPKFYCDPNELGGPEVAEAAAQALAKAFPDYSICVGPSCNTTCGPDTTEGLRRYIRDHSLGAPPDDDR